MLTFDTDKGKIILTDDGKTKLQGKKLVDEVKDQEVPDSVIKEVKDDGK